MLHAAVLVHMLLHAAAHYHTPPHEVIHVKQNDIKIILNRYIVTIVRILPLYPAQVHQSHRPGRTGY